MLIWTGCVCYRSCGRLRRLGRTEKGSGQDLGVPEICVQWRSNSLSILWIPVEETRASDQNSHLLSSSVAKSN